jgi:hypothetical protein
LRYEFLPQSWNNGIVEGWNSGFSKDIVHFRLYPQDNSAIYPILQYPKTHFSNIPAFHHSNWGDAPNLSIEVRERLKND